jgi:hypothetical protein
MKKPKSFLYRNSLSIVLILLFLASLTGQVITGWHDHNNDLRELGAQEIQLRSYLKSGHFVRTTFENWESEFLQMGMYVILTIFLRQIGSSESKPIEGDEAVDREPDSNKEDAPWPVRKGGWILLIYQNSLSIAFVLLFILSFTFHAWGSLRNFNEEQSIRGKEIKSMSAYLGEPTFWFESFQNWQSEFIAVLSIVVLSIFLRQKGSPESKPVDATDLETGEG